MLGRVPTSPSLLLQRAEWLSTHARLQAFLGVRLRLVAAIVAAGLMGGCVSAAYLAALDLTQDAIGPTVWAPMVRVLVLALIGVVVALLVKVLGRPADVELLVDNIHIPDGAGHSSARLRSLLPISLLCIGGGGTLGPEAPLVTTTGTLAHRYATRVGLGFSDVRIVMITGMAAGFAVLFGAPLGAAVFALEIPHRRGIGYHEAAIPACIGAVIGYACSTAAGRLGLAPIWDVPMVDRIDWIDLPWSIVAGLLGAAIAIVFTVATKALASAASFVSPGFRPVLGGAALGVIALHSPYVLTNGEFQIDTISSAVAISALAVAAVAKLAGAAICVATGWRGGFIIPLFFIGFCVGRIVAVHLPGASVWPFVLGVMIAANVGVTKTPLGSTLVVTEMSGSALLPGALIAALVSLIVTSPVGLIDTQRDRVDAYGTGHALR
jgi:H+/Cl- antiporter ClcA